VRRLDDETRLDVFARDGYVCRHCGHRATQIAHRIPNTKTCEKMYGVGIINSPANLRAACSLECNKKLQAPSWTWETVADEVREWQQT